MNYKVWELSYWSSLKTAQKPDPYLLRAFAFYLEGFSAPQMVKIAEEMLGRYEGPELSELILNNSSSERENWALLDRFFKKNELCSTPELAAQKLTSFVVNAIKDGGLPPLAGAAGIIKAWQGHLSKLSDRNFISQDDNAPPAVREMAQIIDDERDQKAAEQKIRKLVDLLADPQSMKTPFAPVVRARKEMVDWMIEIRTGIWNKWGSLENSLPGSIDGPLSKIQLVGVKILTVEETAFISDNSDESFQELAKRLAQDSPGVVSSLTRKSVVKGDQQ